MNPAQATLKAVSRFSSLIVVGGVVVTSRRISFVMGSRSVLVEEKKERPSAKSSFIRGVSKEVVENSWSMCHERRAERYDATVSGLICPCFAMADPIIRPAAQSSSVCAVAGQVVTPMYLV